MRIKRLAIATGAFALGLAAPLASAPPAIAGDYPGHSAATMQAVAQVKAEPEFAKGAGEPLYELFDDHNDDPTCSHDKCKHDAVNFPDDWPCFDTDGSQPPELTQLNSDINLFDNPLTEWLGTRKCPLAMACNYTHFVENPVDEDLPSTERAHDIVRRWADEIVQRNRVLGAIGPDDASLDHFLADEAYCNFSTWQKYWRRILTSLHYVQDSQSEDHVMGNKFCSPYDLVPMLAGTGSGPGFNDGTKCANWLDARWTDMTYKPCVSPLTCDYEVLTPDKLGCMTPSARTVGIMYGCWYLGSAAACMGLERLIWHHCNADPNMEKSFTCSGPLRDNCSIGNGNYGYCEGEVCPNCDKERCPIGGENFVLKAKNVSVPWLERGARAWAQVCKPPPKSMCTPNECQSWCWKTKSNADPTMEVRGDCVDSGDGKGCGCQCSIAGHDEPRPQACGTSDGGMGEGGEAGASCSKQDLPNGSCGGGDLFCIGKMSPCTDPNGVGCCPADQCNYQGSCVQLKCPAGSGRNYSCNCCCTAGMGAAGSCDDTATKFNIHDACDSNRLCGCATAAPTSPTTCGGG